MRQTTEQPRWRQAAEEFAETCEPGTVITENWKIEKFGITRPRIGSVEDWQRYQFDMLQAFESFRKVLLLQYDIYLEPIGRHAHAVVPPAQQTDAAWAKRTRAVGKELAALRRELDHVRLAALSDEQRKENADKKARASKLATLFRAARRGTAPDTLATHPR